MSLAQSITGNAVHEALRAIVESRKSLVVTYRKNTAWASLKAQAAEMSEGYLTLVAASAVEVPSGLKTPCEVGVSFNLGSRKYIFPTTLMDVELVEGASSGAFHALTIEYPDSVQRIERRKSVRAGVPREEIVRASFWPGGARNRPEQLTPACPIWPGKVTDLSVGGFQMRTHVVATTYFQPNDIVGVCLSFDALAKSVTVNAVLCRSQLEGDGMALMGFEFLGLDESPEGLMALELIGSKVTDYLQATG